MLQEAEKTEEFCILLFQPPETAEPSAITGWLGHESLSAVVCSLSALWYCRGVRPPVTWPATNKHYQQNKNNKCEARAVAWLQTIIKSMQIRLTLCISFSMTGKFTRSGARWYAKQLFLQTHRWSMSTANSLSRWHSTSSHGTKARGAHARTSGHK